jgi:ubiquinone/menaquinone biosynthesis C-methylase UbiE
MRDHSPDLIRAAAEVRAEDTVLDVACGPGLMACAFAAVAGHVTGIDLTPAMIKRAKILQESKALPNLSWRIGDVLPLPFADAAFSLVFTRYSFHHLPDPKAVLAEMVRVCAPSVSEGRYHRLRAEAGQEYRFGIINGVPKKRDAFLREMLPSKSFVICEFAEAHWIGL